MLTVHYHDSSEFLAKLRGAATAGPGRTRPRRWPTAAMAANPKGGDCMPRGGWRPGAGRKSKPLEELARPDLAERRPLKQPRPSLGMDEGATCAVDPCAIQMLAAAVPAQQKCPPAATGERKEERDERRRHGDRRPR